MPFKIPVVSAGAKAALGLLTGPELVGREAEVIPFLSELFPRLTDLAPPSGYKWSDLQATALAWWGRPFPRGLLREAESGAVIEIRTGDGLKKVRSVWQSPHFAVTYSQGRGPDHPDGPLYSVTHLASGMAAAQAFLSVDSARAAAQYLASIQTNWESSQPDTGRLPRNLNATLAWVRARKDAPTLTEIEKRAAG